MGAIAPWVGTLSISPRGEVRAPLTPWSSHGDILRSDLGFNDIQDEEMHVHTGHTAVRSVIQCMMRWLQYHVYKKSQRVTEDNIKDR